MKVTLPFIFIIALIAIGCNKKQNQKMNEASAITIDAEKHRPLYHFTPAKKWMNDPNGMVFYEGTYHLFYQHYPDNTVWGPMHWGHATSKDLVNWEHQPIALYPDSLGYIFSGGAVADIKNTSGLGTNENPPLVAFFTYHDPVGAENGSDTFQTQGLAYSLDNGKSWIKYENNPVISNPGIRDFRDPNVFWHEASQKWILLLAAQDKIMFYQSENLINWEFTSEFGENSGSHGGVWECPDLFSLPHPKNPDEMVWVLLVSINPGGPNGGSVTQYFLGDFDGKSFKNQFPKEKTLWLDYGTDNYAGVTWSDIPKEDGRRIFIGWMSNWDYANVVPTKSWRSAMTVPRKLELKSGKEHILLTNEPVKELEQLRSASTDIESGVLEANRTLQTNNPLCELHLQIDLGESTAKKIGIKLSNDKSEKIIAAYHVENQNYFIDRTGSGKHTFSDKFSGIHTAPRLVDNNIIELQVLVDVASIEFFADEGRTVLTDIFFPTEPFNKIELFTEGGSAKIIKGKSYTLSPSIIQ